MFLCLSGTGVCVCVFCHFALSVVILRFIQYCYDISILLLFIGKEDFILQIHYDVFIYFLGDGHLGCFQFGAIVNKAAVNILV